MARPLPAPLLCLLVVALPALGQSDAVEVKAVQFGVGSTCRPGEYTGVQLELRGTDLPGPTPIWVQLESPNADGDIVEHGRSLTLAGGQTLRTWVYLPLAPDVDPRGSNVYTVRVFEERDGRRRAELGGARISPRDAGANIVEPATALLAVVGPGQASAKLTDYTNPSPFPGRPVFAHEDTRVVFGLRPEDLPDRWEGFKGFEAVAWCETQPTELRDDQVRALCDYVQRGGHLVISLPETGDPWGLANPGQSRFHDLMPQDPPQREDTALLADLLPVLTKARSVERDLEVTVHVFQRVGPAGSQPAALANHYRPLIVTDDGRTIAVQRTYGFGRITVLGLNLANRRVLSLPRAVQADILWNRILGRRLDTPSGIELNDIESAKMRSVAAVTDHNLGSGQAVTPLINMIGTAGRGLGASFLLFVVYWVVAGMGSYLVLKHYRLEHHAWVAFAASAAVFTALAWGLVALIKPTTHRVKHITFLDMVARPEGERTGDPQHMRAVSYFSLNLPGYRPTPVFVESSAEQRDLLDTWAPPDEPPQPFPNPDRLCVDVGSNPADLAAHERRGSLPEFRRPSRATATQMYAHWMGGNPQWTGTIRSDPADPIHLALVAGREELRGSIIHDLPATLDDVTIYWVANRRLAPRSYSNQVTAEDPWVRPLESGAMLNSGEVVRLAGGRWEPGTARRMVADMRSTTPLARWMSDLVEPFRRDAITETLARKGKELERLKLLSIFNQLDPPAYLLDRPDGAGRESAVFFRHLGRELDLSLWYTGACLIVMGELRGPHWPVPLSVDGERPEIQGDSVTVVRWVCPLDVFEEIAFPAAFGRNVGGGKT